MKSDSRRKRHRILAFVAAGAVSLVVVLVLLFTVNSLRGPRHLDESPSQRPTQPNAQPTSPTRPKKPRPEFQDASCPDVQLVSVPGSWESSPQQDPLNPVQFPNALLLNVTGPLTGQFDPSRLQTYTVPYTAEFHKPFSDDDNISYDASRREGFDATWKALEDMTARCPLTSYVLVGFSQGAVIAGDIASEIGNGRGPVDEDLVLGVTLIADGRREANVGQDLDQNPPGEGAEITLQHVPLLSGDTLKPFGITMTGPRDGGFGTLDNRTFQICAEGDLICAAPVEAFDIGRLPATIDALTGGAAAPVHALYNTTQFWSADGQPATVWARNWAAEVIAGAPRPKRG